MVPSTVKAQVYADKEQDEEDGFNHDLNLVSSRRPMHFLTSSIFYHLVILLIMSGATLLMSSSQYKLPNSSHSPAQEAVKYERRILDNNLDVATAYKGLPSPEVDQAWDELLKDRNLALDPSVVGSSVEINDGSGKVLASLSVYYSIQCLNYVRKYIFRDHYNVSFPENGLRAQKDHVVHCVDVIRQSLICHGDLAVHGFSWDPDRKPPSPDFRIEHTCKNWDRVQDWARKHSAPKLEGDVLSHPVFGSVFPTLDH